MGTQGYGAAPYREAAVTDDDDIPQFSQKIEIVTTRQLPGGKRIAELEAENARLTDRADAAELRARHGEAAGSGRDDRSSVEGGGGCSETIDP